MPPSPLTTGTTLFYQYGMLPACVIKNIVNVFQLTSSSYAIAQADVKAWNEKK